MPDATATIHQIPLAEIDDNALTRDRSGLGADALTELKTSIAASGLRQPVELFALSDPRPPHRYGLLSGLRRLAAFRDLHELTGQERYAGGSGLAAQGQDRLEDRDLAGNVEVVRSGRETGFDHRRACSDKGSCAVQGQINRRERGPKALGVVQADDANR